MKRCVKVTQRILGMLLILVMCMGILLEPVKTYAAWGPCLTPDTYVKNHGAVYNLGEEVEISFRMVSGSYETVTYVLNLYYGGAVADNLIASVNGEIYDVPEESVISASHKWNTWGFPAGYYTVEVQCMYYDQGEWNTELSSCESWSVRLAETGAWKKDNVGWWYRLYDGSYPYSQWKYIDNIWYYFNSSGYMVTGWKFINGHWYYFNNSGAMATGWIIDRGVWYFLDRNGAMVTGWNFINGHWYYFNGSGAMLANQWVGYYYVTSSGAMATNRWIDGYYVGSNGCRLVF